MGRYATVVLMGWLVACGGKNSPPPVGGTAGLETGAKLVQDVTPVKQIGVYLVGFHPMKDDPTMQVEAHHYCNPVNEEFAQCVLFDGNTAKANMTGMEYIISERLFQTLPSPEKGYWHPHNYEILSGQLAAPGMPEAAEKEFMRKKMNSYGKTWHTWMSTDAVPMGEARLAWSFNRDGEMRSGLLVDWDRRMGMDSGARRTNRLDLVPLARPQVGVDEMKGKFEGETREIPGIVEAR